jgi:hypothetical protein
MQRIDCRARRITFGVVYLCRVSLHIKRSQSKNQQGTHRDKVWNSKES